MYLGEVRGKQEERSDRSLKNCHKGKKGGGSVTAELGMYVCRVA